MKKAIYEPEDFETKEEYDKFVVFAWYNTCTDQIESYNGETMWYSWKEFEYDYTYNNRNVDPIRLLRYHRLFINYYYEDYIIIEGISCQI